MDVVEGSSAGFAEQFGDAAFAAVIGGEGERPVAEPVAEGFEVFGGGTGVFDGVEAFILGGEAETELLGGGGHELIQAGGPDGAAGFGVEGGFGFGLPDEFGGDSFRTEGAFDFGQEGGGARGGGPVREFSEPDFLAFDVAVAGFFDGGGRRSGDGGGRGVGGMGDQRWLGLWRGGMGREGFLWRRGMRG